MKGLCGMIDSSITHCSKKESCLRYTKKECIIWANLFGFDRGTMRKR